MLVAERVIGQIDALFDGRTSAIARDLKLNLKKILTESALEPGEAATALLAVATAVDRPDLEHIARTWLGDLDVTPDEITEAGEAAALMGMLNTYYSGRGKLAGDSAYGPAGLRMTALARPLLGKQRFEMLAFAVSVVNGCPTCITSHEQVLKDSGVPVAKLHDLLRLASVVKGLKALR